MLPALGRRTPVAWATSILIDVDHYLWFAFRFRNPSFLDAVSYFLPGRASSRPPSLNVFHTAEFLVLLSAAGVFSPQLSAVLYGCLFHLLADTYDDIGRGMLFHRRRSIVLAVLRNRRGRGGMG